MNINNIIDDNNVEQWKDLKYRDINFSYQISNHGDIRNKEKLNILKPNLRDGYRSINLSYFVNDEQNKLSIKIHRLVALHFVENNDPKKNVVNHKDGNKLNNHYTNLEWTTLTENNQHAIDNGLTKITKRRVTQMDIDGKELKIFESLDQAKQQLGINDSDIVSCCKGRKKLSGGFKWKYTDINPNEVILTDEELLGYKQVNDFPNYMINNEGKVYSKPYHKFLKTIMSREGSLQLQLTKNNNKKTYLLHNLVADHYVDKVDGKLFVTHINGDKKDNRAINLKRVDLKELNVR
jgi:aspartyl-tRNA synthetase